jgi:hypothetical protein
MPGHAGEQKTDAFEHGSILEGQHEVKVGSVTGTENNFEMRIKIRICPTRR